MPARSKAQQEAAGIALAAKRGEIPVAKLKGASMSMYELMSEQSAGRVRRDATQGSATEEEHEEALALASA